MKFSVFSLVCCSLINNVCYAKIVHPSKILKECTVKVTLDKEKINVLQTSKLTIARGNGQPRSDWLGTGLIVFESNLKISEYLINTSLTKDQSEINFYNHQVRSERINGNFERDTKPDLPLNEGELIISDYYRMANLDETELLNKMGLGSGKINLDNIKKIKVYKITEESHFAESMALIEAFDVNDNSLGLLANMGGMYGVKAYCR